MYYLIPGVLIFVIGAFFTLFSRLAIKFSAHVLRRIPAKPFLAMTPATTPLGRALTVAPIMAGVLGMAALVARSDGDWLLLPAIVVLVFVSIGCSRSFATLWWPAALGASLFILGQGLALLSSLLPQFWKITLEPGSPAALGLIGGAAAMFASALWSTIVVVVTSEEDS
jgi:hypothetical protein